MTDEEQKLIKEIADEIGRRCKPFSFDQTLDSYTVIREDEYDRLKRLEENVKKANAELDKEIAQIESGESLTNVLDDDYFTLKDKKRLLESLDK